ncbi:addiction module antidote protein, HigA family [Herbaspirillum seropedicae]|uniref:HigA family addiction module antitoxin n=1 Tax=Herbaspirillum seropedicae TaxID=964 RepID=UPI00111E678E|nr:HigA family addiction module antitoxin [Herbaspirillum seropedicae]QDD63456.1 addiction module antidote protein, HigA family [Herbaspirillum seropedicae]
MREIDSVSPGELLKREFLEPLCITQYRLAKEIGVSQLRISEIVNGKRAITADTDLRLARFFGLSDGYWLRAQVVHDTEVAREKMSDVLAGIKQWQPKESTPA